MTVIYSYTSGEKETNQPNNPTNKERMGKTKRVGKEWGRKCVLSINKTT